MERYFGLMQALWNVLNCIEHYLCAAMTARRWNGLYWPFRFLSFVLCSTQERGEGIWTEQYGLLFISFSGENPTPSAGEEIRTVVCNTHIFVFFLS